MPPAVAVTSPTRDFAGDAEAFDLAGGDWAGERLELHHADVAAKVSGPGGQRVFRDEQLHAAGDVPGARRQVVGDLHGADIAGDGDVAAEVAGDADGLDQVRRESRAGGGGRELHRRDAAFDVERAGEVYAGVLPASAGRSRGRRRRWCGRRRAGRCRCRCR